MRSILLRVLMPVVLLSVCLAAPPGCAGVPAVFTQPPPLQAPAQPSGVPPGPDQAGLVAQLERERQVYEMRQQVRELGERVAATVAEIGTRVAASFAQSIPAVGGLVADAVKSAIPAVREGAGNAGERGADALFQWLAGLFGVTTAGAVAAAAKQSQRAANLEGQNAGWDAALAAAGGKPPPS